MSRNLIFSKSGQWVLINNKWISYTQYSHERRERERRYVRAVEVFCALFFILLLFIILPW